MDQTNATANLGNISMSVLANITQAVLAANGGGLNNSAVSIPSTATSPATVVDGTSIVYFDNSTNATNASMIPDGFGSFFLSRPDCVMSTYTSDSLKAVQLAWVRWIHHETHAYKIMSNNILL
jgi:hypothetical protein